MSEVPTIKLPKVKEDLTIGKCRFVNREIRRPVSVSLPVYLQGATPPRPDLSDPLNVVLGAAKRFGYEPPKPNKTEIRKLKRFTDLWLKHNLKPLSEDEVPSFEEWLSSTTYTQKRQDQLAKLWREKGGNIKLKDLLKLKSFLKDETYPEYKYPRCINSRVDLAKCFFGPIVAAISKKVFSLPWFIKNTPVADRPIAIRDTLLTPDGEYTFTDYTAFEAHFIPLIMKATQFRLFNYMTQRLSIHNMLMDFLHQCIAGRNICVFKFVSITVNGVRMSGEMDTSLSNGFTNLMNFLYLCQQNNAVDVRGFVEGDDGLFIVRPTTANPTEQQFSNLGFTIKIGKTKNLSEASFCGQVYDMDDLIVVTDPTEVVARLGWTNQKYVQATEKTKLELLRAKALSLAYQYNGCPILSALGHRLIQLTNHITIRKSIIDQMDEWERTRFLQATLTAIPVKYPGAGTRALVEKLYSIPIWKQIKIEREIQSYSFGPFRMDLDYPDHWVDYIDRYSHTCNDYMPSWLERSECNVKNLLLVNAPQAKDFLQSL